MPARPRRQAKRRKHRFLWVTDPWDSLDHPRDTTLRLAREAASQGFESHWCDVRTIRLEEGRVLLSAAPVDPESNAPTARPFPARICAPTDFSSVHYRVDPPVDLSYLHPLQLLAISNAPVVNPARVLMSHNEKLEATGIQDAMPETIAASQWETLCVFGKKYGKTVLKPMHQAQSKGVQLLSWSSQEDQEENRIILQEATDHFTRPVVLQRFLAGISRGEQRVWFLDGKILACVRKMPMRDDFRVNIDQGSALRKTELSREERKLSLRIGAYLRKNHIRLAAVDLIENYVTDFNFTSPGLITLMEETLGKDLARPIICALGK